MTRRQLPEALTVLVVLTASPLGAQPFVPWATTWSQFGPAVADVGALAAATCNATYADQVRVVRDAGGGAPGFAVCDGAGTWDVTTGGGGTDDQTAAEVAFTPTGGLVATDVQAALAEVDAEHTVDTTLAGTAVSGDLSGTLPGPLSLAADTVGLAELAACTGPDEMVEYGASGVPSCVATPGGGSSFAWITEADSDVILSPPSEVVIRQPGGTAGVDEATLVHSGVNLAITNRDSSPSSMISLTAQGGGFIFDGAPGTADGWGFNVSTGIYEASGGFGPRIRYTIPSSTNPSIIPGQPDTNTGLTRCGEDCVGLVGGGASLVEAQEAANNSVTIRKTASQSAPLLVVEGQIRITVALLGSCTAGLTGTFAQAADGSACYCNGSVWSPWPATGTCS